VGYLSGSFCVVEEDMRNRECQGGKRPERSRQWTEPCMPQPEMASCHRKVRPFKHDSLCGSVQSDTLDVPLPA
jgi:hypothetical protein